MKESQWCTLTINEKRSRKRREKEEISAVVKQRRRNICTRTNETIGISNNVLVQAKAVGAAKFDIKKERVLSKGNAHDIAALFNIGSVRTLRRYISKMSTDMDIEVYVDRARSGRPSEITSEDMKTSFLQYLASRGYHFTVRCVTRWLKSR